MPVTRKQYENRLLATGDLVSDDYEFEQQSGGCSWTINY